MDILEIKKTFGDLIAPVELRKLSIDEVHLDLTASAKFMYDFYGAKFIGHDTSIILIVVKGYVSFSFLEKQYKRFIAVPSSPILFVFENLNTKEKKSLIQKRIPFMITGKFLYAPMLGFTGETPIFNESWNSIKETRKLSPQAENLVIKHLLDCNFDKLSGNEIAKIVNSTAMTASRLIKELENAELITIEKVGAKRIIKFKQREILWHKVKRLLTSPVIETIQLNQLPMKLPLSGDSALEHYTMLVGNAQSTYAIYKKDFAKLLKDGEITHNDSENHINLEIWTRDPSFLAKNGYIDPVSLYISVKNSYDERVLLEIKNMMLTLDLKVENNE